MHNVINVVWILLYLSQLSFITAVNATSNINILSVGDWGSAALGGYHLRNAQDTSNAMQAYLNEYSPKLVLNPGDNFYYCGIQNGSDPQINEDFIKLFGGIHLPWYNVLGNHDYGFNPDAQLWLNQTISTWIMDARYYHRRVVLDPDPDPNSSLILNIIVLDTNPCISDYRGNDRAKWDPCGIQYPTCEPIADECRFHENILQQDCKAQLEWFRTTLESIDATNEWIFVLGHHKANEIDVEDFQDVLSDARIHLYINGHTHLLDHYAIDDAPKYMTTGAGGMVIIGQNEEGESNDEAVTTMINATITHRVRSMWSKVITGFTPHTFINSHDSYSKMITEFWDTKQNLLYNFTIYKNSTITTM